MFSVPLRICDHLHLLTLAIGWAKDAISVLGLVGIGCWGPGLLHSCDMFGHFSNSVIAVLLSPVLLVVVGTLLDPVTSHVVVLRTWHFVLLLRMNFDKLVGIWVQLLRE